MTPNSGFRISWHSCASWRVRASLDARSTSSSDSSSVTELDCSSVNAKHALAATSVTAQSTAESRCDSQPAQERTKTVPKPPQSARLVTAQVRTARARSESAGSRDRHADSMVCSASSSGSSSTQPASAKPCA